MWEWYSETMDSAEGWQTLFHYVLHATRGFASPVIISLTVFFVLSHLEGIPGSMVLPGSYPKDNTEVPKEPISTYGDPKGAIENILETPLVLKTEVLPVQGPPTRTPPPGPNCPPLIEPFPSEVPTQHHEASSKSEELSWKRALEYARQKNSELKERKRELKRELKMVDKSARLQERVSKAERLALEERIRKLGRKVPMQDARASAVAGEPAIVVEQSSRDIKQLEELKKEKDAVEKELQMTRNTADQRSKSDSAEKKSLTKQLVKLQGELEALRAKAQEKKAIAPSNDRMAELDNENKVLKIKQVESQNKIDRLSSRPLPETHEALQVELKTIKEKYAEFESREKEVASGPSTTEYEALQAEFLNIKEQYGEYRREMEPKTSQTSTTEHKTLQAENEQLKVEGIARQKEIEELKFRPSISIHDTLNAEIKDLRAEQGVRQSEIDKLSSRASATEAEALKLRAEMDTVCGELALSKANAQRLEDGWRACDQEKWHIHGLYRQADEYAKKSLKTIQSLEKQLSAEGLTEDESRQAIEVARSEASRLREQRDQYAECNVNANNALEYQKQENSRLSHALQKLQEANATGNTEFAKQVDLRRQAEQMIRNGQQEVKQLKDQIVTCHAEKVNMKAEISLLQESLEAEKKISRRRSKTDEDCTRAMILNQTLQNDLDKERAGKVNFSQKAIEDLELKARRALKKETDVVKVYTEEKNKTRKLEGKLSDLQAQLDKKEGKNGISIREHLSRMKRLESKVEGRFKAELDAKDEQLSANKEEGDRLTTDLKIAMDVIAGMDQTRPAYESKGGRKIRTLDDSEDAGVAQEDVGDEADDSRQEMSADTVQAGGGKRVRRAEEIDDLFDGELDEALTNPSEESAMEH